MKKYVYVGIGGFIGAISRVLIENLNLNNYYNGIIPIKTFFVNITGSFLLAAISIYFVEKMTRHLNIQLMLCTGFAGAYTTFSTMCKEFWNIFSNGYYHQAVFYILFSIIAGFSSSVLGVYFGKYIIRKTSYNKNKTEDIHKVKDKLESENIDNK
ncbi:CrcB family protein [Clostridium sp. cel8]|jgi:fluoride exporter|uniref:fluoride efflux transporter FluC n=1 Tax=Clostridium sp. cel8 TaxID=2663123 RepID=UPI0015F40172|nr:CrcB family protein [Clostridium sp. cel8]MBA5850132.1 CrcB family protein [Clostridium sp. cel8]